MTGLESFREDREEETKEKTKAEAKESEEGEGSEEVAPDREPTLEEARDADTGDPWFDYERDAMQRMRDAFGEAPKPNPEDEGARDERELKEDSELLDKDEEARIIAARAIRRVEEKRKEKGVEVVPKASEGGEVGEKTRDGDKPQDPEDAEGKRVVAKAGLGEVYRAGREGRGMSEGLEERATFSYETSKGEKHTFELRTSITAFTPFYHRPRDVVSIDLTPLSNCHRITYISLGSIQLRELDLTPLAHLKELNFLNLKWNKLKILDLSPLLSCPKLTHLVIGGNPFEHVDPSPIAQMRLEKLDVSGVRGAHIGLVRNSPELEWLDLSNCALPNPDLTLLRHNPKLTLLNLHRNDIQVIDLEPLRYLTNLRVLSLDNNQLSSIDLEPLSSSKELRDLDLRNNLLSSIDLEPLRRLRRLRGFGLWLEGNPLQTLDVSPIFSCWGFRRIAVDDDVELTADSSLKEQKRLPTGIRRIRDRIIWK